MRKFGGNTKEVLRGNKNHIIPYLFSYFPLKGGILFRLQYGHPKTSSGHRRKTLEIRGNHGKFPVYCFYFSYFPVFFNLFVFIFSYFPFIRFYFFIFSYIFPFIRIYFFVFSGHPFLIFSYPLWSLRDQGHSKHFYQRYYIISCYIALDVAI